MPLKLCWTGHVTRQHCSGLGPDKGCPRRFRLTSHRPENCNNKFPSHHSKFINQQSPFKTKTAPGKVLGLVICSDRPPPHQPSPVAPTFRFWHFARTRGAHTAADTSDRHAANTLLLTLRKDTLHTPRCSHFAWTQAHTSAAHTSQGHTQLNLSRFFCDVKIGANW